MPAAVRPPKTIVHKFLPTAGARKQRTITFVGGNGFSALCFEPLLKLLAKEGYAVEGLELLPLNAGTPIPAEHFGGDPHHYHGFDGLAADILRYLQHERSTPGEPTCMVGWSMGATAAAMAASKRPELFTGGLVLIDPANLSPALKPIHHMIPHRFRYPLLRHFEPVKSTTLKKDRWPSRDAFEQEWLSKTRLLRNVKSPEVRAALKQHMVVDEDESNAGGSSSSAVRLAFSREWENHFFLLPSNLWSSMTVLRQHAVPEAKVQVPMMAICAKPSLFCSEADHRRMEQNLCNVHRFDYTHLLPLEAPELCAQLIAPFVR